MLIGNLGRDPEMNVTTEGTPFTRFTLAVNRRAKSSSGERETDWFNIVAWRQLAETCNTYLHKGSKVYIEGRLVQRKYTDKNGIERSTVDVIANDMEILTPKGTQGSSGDFLASGTEESFSLDSDEFP
jgi:single-strand DNA-binding protein